MKKKLLICASVLASALVSCDSFLDREPLDKISSEAYFKTAKDLELYVNQFYTVFPAFGGFGIGYLATDGNSDNMVTEDYNTQLAGYTTVPGNASDAGWNWERSVLLTICWVIWDTWRLRSIKTSNLSAKRTSSGLTIIALY